jgi:hypothetical protein
MHQLAGGVHDNTDDTSDDEAIPTPCAPQGISKWGQVTCWTNSNIHLFTDDMTGKRQNVAPHINKALTPFSVFTLLVEKTNQYYQQYLDFLDNEPSPVPNVTESEMFLYLAIIIQVGHDICDKLKDYWSTTAQFFLPFHGNTIKHGRFLHILRFLHFSNNDNASESNNPNYDRPWKIRQIFDMLNDAYSKYYAPSELLAVDSYSTFQAVGNFQTIHTQQIQTFCNKNV